MVGKRLSPLYGLLIVSVALSGCGIAARQEAEQAEKQRRADMEAAFTACDQTQFSGKTQHRDRAQCMVNVANRYIRPIDPYPELLDLLSATRLSIASRVDRGEITEDDARLAFQQKMAELTSERERRNQGRDMVSAQQQAANAATYQALWGNRRTCTRIGNTVNCY